MFSPESTQYAPVEAQPPCRRGNLCWWRLISAQCANGVAQVLPYRFVPVPMCGGRWRRQNPDPGLAERLDLRPELRLRSHHPASAGEARESENAWVHFADPDAQSLDRRTAEALRRQLAVHAEVVLGDVGQTDAERQQLWIFARLELAWRQ